MDWENEQYVRLYTRDTTNWKRLCWQARSVLPLLLRKVDLAGALDLEGLEPWEAVMLHIDLPEEVVRPAVAQLLDAKHKVLEVRGKVLVFPNHIPAQTATKSDKLRQKESRDRRALGIHVRSQDVTAQSRIVTAESQDATSASRDSKPAEEAGSNVTLGHSLLCSALLCDALPCSAVREGERAPEPEALPTPPANDTAEPTAADLLDEAERRTAACTTAIRIAFARRYEKARKLEWNRAKDPALDDLGGWLARNSKDLDADIARMLEAFFADSYVQKLDYPVGLLFKQVAKFFSPPAAVRDVRTGFAAPAPASAFTNPTDLSKIFRPRPAKPAGDAR